MKKQRFSRCAGQVTVEYLLLAVALFSLFHLMAKFTRGEMGVTSPLVKFQSMPSQGLASAIESGVWDKNPREARNQHPNHQNSHFSSKGKGP